MMRSRRHLSFAVLAAVVLALAAVMPAHAVIQGTSWFPIGPAPSCCFFPGGEAAGLRRSRSTGELPRHLDRHGGGGVWNSTDGGVTWRPMSDNEKSLAIGALVLADCNDQGCARVYAGTGEDATRRDTYYGRGLLVGTVTRAPARPPPGSSARAGTTRFRPSTTSTASRSSASSSTPRPCCRTGRSTSPFRAASPRRPANPRSRCRSSSRAAMASTSPPTTARTG